MTVLTFTSPASQQLALSEDDRVRAITALADLVAEDHLDIDDNRDAMVIATCLRSWAGPASTEALAYAFREAVEARRQAQHGAWQFADDVALWAQCIVDGTADSLTPYVGSGYVLHGETAAMNTALTSVQS